MGLIVFILVITIAVYIHEMGHYIACRALRVPVGEFSVGFGTKLFSKKAFGTEWNLRLIPLGGYILPNAEIHDNVAPWKKAVIAVAGPVANLLPFAALLVYSAGILATIRIFGAMYWQTAKAFLSLFLIPLNAFGLFMPDAKAGSIIGPVGIGQTAIHGAAEVGMLATGISLFIMLSIGLAMANLLPIVPLDGGRIVLAGVEKVFGKAKAETTRNWMLAIGGSALAFFIIVIMIRDISRLF
jgi:regulator of sigma E protease